MLKLASHLVRSRHGVFYLRTTAGGRDRRVSLRTRSPEVAKILAYEFGAAGGKMALDRIHQLKVKLPDGIEVETDGSEKDHNQLMDILALALKHRNISQPSPQSAPVPAKPLSIRAAVEKYMSERDGTITAGTVRTWGTTFNRLIRKFGHAPAHTVTAEQISLALKDFGEDHAPSSVKRDATTLSLLWRWMIRNGHALENPVVAPTYGRGQLARLKDEYSRERLLYEPADLAKIFDEARLNSLARPEDIFLPILGCWTGARLEALCRLKTGDITADEIRFDAGHDKTGKGRTIPMHPALLAFGFVDYVEDVQMHFGDGYIFPHLNEVRGRRGHYFSRQYSLQRAALGIETGKDFHSFRTSLISNLQANGCPGDLRRLYVGHETGEQLDVHDRVYSKMKLTPTILGEKLFPFLSITPTSWCYQKGSAVDMIERLMDKRNRGAMQRARRTK